MDEALSQISRPDLPARRGLALLRLGLTVEQYNLDQQHGNGRRAGRKFTVEECVALGAVEWAEHIWPSTEQWTAPGSTLRYRFDRVACNPGWQVFRFGYEPCSSEAKQPSAATYTVCLSGTPTQFGGMRWLFLCPVVTKGVWCGRRVMRLYLPPGARCFGCRHCHRLSYTSRQTSRESDPA